MPRWPRRKAAATRWKEIRKDFAIALPAASRSGEIGSGWKDGKLLFKADIIADTPQVIYLEGIYVDPSERGKGYGSTCLSQLGRILLRRTGSICLTLNASKEKTKNFYVKAGYAPAQLLRHYLLTNRPLISPQSVSQCAMAKQKQINAISMVGNPPRRMGHSCRAYARAVGQVWVCDFCCWPHYRGD